MVDAGVAKLQGERVIEILRTESGLVTTYEGVPFSISVLSEREILRIRPPAGVAVSGEYSGTAFCTDRWIGARPL